MIVGKPKLSATAGKTNCVTLGRHADASILEKL
jgi:hypothetical protein